MLVTAGGTTRAAVHSMAYNEKGQRLECECSGEADLQSTAAYRTRYTYEPETFRLQSLITVRTGTGVVLQRLEYTYDPVGNIVEIHDSGTPVPIYAGLAAVADGRYEYDALYRLTLAEGREHPGQQMGAEEGRPGELPIGLPGPNDTSGLTRYTETYDYDAVGNIRRMHHQPDGYEAWERRYLYANMPESGAAVRSNRLLATSNPGDVEGVYSARYAYADGTDANDPTGNNAGLHGSMTAMPHLPSIHWDYADRMQSCTKTVGPNPDRVYFTYDASGQRVRKVYEHAPYREERIYLGGYEVYRSWSTGANASLDVHRTTLHVMDDQRRVAMVENTIEDTDEDVPAGRRWRFQLDNHLGTATLELDHEGNVISYEEYHPYGTSAVRVQRSGTGFSQKRYRYTGKERDEETGLYYHGARYYAPWLGRWTAADPLGVAQPGKPDLNLFSYANCKPLTLVDLDGMQASLSALPPRPGSRDPESPPVGLVDVLDPNFNGIISPDPNATEALAQQSEPIPEVIPITIAGGDVPVSGPGEVTENQLEQGSQNAINEIESIPEAPADLYPDVAGSGAPGAGASPGEQVLGLLGNVAVGAGEAYVFGAIAGAYPPVGIALAAIGIYEVATHFQEYKEKFLSDPNFAASVIGGLFSTAGARGYAEGVAARESLPANVLLSGLGPTGKGSSPLVYSPTPKHEPGGWGTIMDLDPETAASVLQTSIPGGKARYSYHEGKLYEFQPDNRGGFHGYPVHGNEVPPSVLKAMKNAGTLSNALYRRFVKGQ
jgi:RHS repeat-associated protein